MNLNFEIDCAIDESVSINEVYDELNTLTEEKLNWFLRRNLWRIINKGLYAIIKDKYIFYFTWNNIDKIFQLYITTKNKFMESRKEDTILMPFEVDWRDII